jgi:hypothetical protein
MGRFGPSALGEYAHCCCAGDCQWGQISITARNGAGGTGRHILARFSSLLVFRTLYFRCSEHACNPVIILLGFHYTHGTGYGFRQFAASPSGSGAGGPGGAIGDADGVSIAVVNELCFGRLWALGGARRGPGGGGRSGAGAGSRRARPPAPPPAAAPGRRPRRGRRAARARHYHKLFYKTNITPLNHWEASPRKKVPAAVAKRQRRALRWRACALPWRATRRATRDGRLPCDGESGALLYITERDDSCSNMCNIESRELRRRNRRLL